MIRPRPWDVVSAVEARERDHEARREVDRHLAEAQACRDEGWPELAPLYDHMAAEATVKHALRKARSVVR